VAIRRELLMAAQPKMSPPHARFWKQAAAIMALLGALGFVMVELTVESMIVLWRRCAGCECLRKRALLLLPD
jgi:hypothetical protein